MARPRKDNPLTVLSVRVEPSTADRVAALALETDKSQSELLRLIVTLGVSALESATTDEAPPPAEPLGPVWRAVEQHVDKRTGLVRVPVIVRELRDAGHTVESIIDTLNQLDSIHGMIELRPESGVSLLSKTDAALCPKGVRGQPLSWAHVRLR